MKSDHEAKIKISEKNERISVSIDKSKKTQNSSLSNVSGEEHSYNIISLLKKDGQPDIVYNSNYIKGKEYIIKNTDSLSETSPNKSKASIHFSDEDNISQEEYEYESILKPRRLRYFNAFEISHKCVKCKKGGHLALTCPEEIEYFCFRCLGKNHLIENCKNYKCFKCNKFGHKNFECKNVDGIKCYRCHSLGHLQDDCIKFPFYKEKRLLSDFCLKIDRSLGELPNIKKIFILNDRQSLHDKMVQKLAGYPTCPKCTDKHSLEKCPRNMSIPRKRNNLSFKKNY